MAYLKPGGQPSTLSVFVNAETGASAKNRAITAANDKFKGVTIIEKNYDHHLWGLLNFPDVLSDIEEMQDNN